MTTQQQQPRRLGASRVLRLAFTGPSGRYTRCLFLREKAEGEGEGEEGRALHVCNLPPRCTDDFLHGVFGACGRIVAVAHETRGGGGGGAALPGDAATVVFASEDALRAALALPDADAAAAAAAVSQTTSALELWLADARARLARARDPQALAAAADAAAAAFVARRRAEADAREQAATTADDDGFTLVVRRRGNKRARNESAAEAAATAATTTTAALGIRAARPPSRAKLAAQRRTAEAERTAVLADFYRFDRGEARNAQLDSLRTRFELDRQRVARMKANRKFNC